MKKENAIINLVLQQQVLHPQPPGCVQVTDVSIVVIAESCPWLKSVDLSGKDWRIRSKWVDRSNRITSCNSC